MEELEKFLEDVVGKLGAFEGDIQRTIYNLEKKEKDGENAPQKDMKSLQPVTRLRENEEEIKEANENPEITFIVDKLNDIFEG